MPRDNDTFFCDVYAGDDIYWPRGPELCQGPSDEPGLISSDLAPDPDAYVSSAMYAVRGTSRTGDCSGLVATGQLNRPDPALDLGAFASLISRARSGYEK